MVWGGAVRRSVAGLVTAALCVRVAAGGRASVREASGAVQWLTRQSEDVHIPQSLCLVVNGFISS